MTGSAPYGLHDRGAIGVEMGRIAWVGAESALPGAPAALAREVHDLGGRLLILLGPVYPHNHAVYHGGELRQRFPAPRRGVRGPT